MPIFLMLNLIVMMLTCCQPTAPHIKEAGRIMGRFCKRAEKQYNLSCYGSGGSLMGDIQTFDLTFQSYEKINVEKAREKYVRIMEDFLEQTNQDEGVRPYLHQYPLPIEGFELGLIFGEKTSDEFVEQPYVAIVFLGKGYVYYESWNREKDCFENLLKEPYSEAYEKVFHKPWQGTSNYLSN